MEILCLGGDWKDSNNFIPAVVPTSADTVILDQLTQDIYCDINSSAGAINMTNFKNDIYYCIEGGTIKMAGAIKNENKYDLFQARPDIQRIN